MESLAKICRFCLKNCDSAFSAIVENTIEMLDMLLLKMNLLVSEEPVMCSDCAEKIKTFFSFKSTCLDTEDYIVSCASEKEEEKVDLKDGYLSNTKYENATNILGDCTKCRLCMDVLKSSLFISLDDENKDVTLEKIMLLKCLPELDISVTKKSVICSLCHKHLQNYYSFIMNCFIVEEKINKYCQTITNKQGLIKLQDVLQFSTKNMCEEGDNIDDISDIEVKLDKEENNQDEVKREHIELEIGKQNYRRIIQCSKKKVGSEDVEYKVVLDEVKDTLLGEDEIKIEQEEESLVEMKSLPLLSYEEDEVKIDQHDLNSFHDIIMPKLEVGVELFKRESSLLPVASRSSSSTSLNSDSSETIMFKCGSCPYQTKRKNNLRRHILTHKSPSETTIFKCDSCAHQTKYKEGLRRHMLIHKDTSEITMFKCDSCQYQTKFKDLLRKHMRKHKSSLKTTTFKCDSCAHQTKYKEALRRHMLIHKDASEITMFKCDSCQYQTKFKDCLKRHNVIHGDTSETTMFKCDSCPFQTKYKYYFKRHMLVHKDTSETTMFMCDYCAYQTKYKKILRRHRLIHKDASETILFKCDSCLYQTKRERNLRQHLRIHKRPSEIM